MTPDAALNERPWGEDKFFDSAIVRHGFAPYMRDYDVIIEVPAAKPDGSGSYVEGRYRYRFTHCVEARARTAVPAQTWRESWTDEFIDFATWENAGNPEGFVWGVNYADAYPGARTVSPSDVAARWSSELGQTMHEIEIETNSVVVTLVCHDLEVHQLAAGDPVTGALTPCDS